MKVIYMGIPVRLCSNEMCSTVFGPWAWLMNLVPFNGWFFLYNGPYLKALWQWFRGLN